VPTLVDELSCSLKEMAGHQGRWRAAEQHVRRPTAASRGPVTYAGAKEDAPRKN